MKEENDEGVKYKLRTIELLLLHTVYYSGLLRSIHAYNELIVPLFVLLKPQMGQP